ncbi:MULTISPECIES: hypothetical protein [Pseudoalteromonas]|nr:hypothetical protein [Pseudoalteromonas porphyrae]
MKLGRGVQIQWYVYLCTGNDFCISAIVGFTTDLARKKGLGMLKMVVKE